MSQPPEYSYHPESSQQLLYSSQQPYADNSLSPDKAKNGPVESLGSIDEIPLLNSSTVSESCVTIRIAFLRKVYLLLSLQLLWTIVLCVLFYCIPSWKEFAETSLAAMIVSIVLTFVFLGLCIYFQRKHPWNLVLLTCFTLCIGYSVAITVGRYSVLVIMESLVITAAIFLSLTVYTLTSKRDFTGWGPALSVVLMGLVFTMIVQLFLAFVFGIRSTVFDIIISCVTAILFSLYIVYDTYMIFNKYSPEEYIMAVISLYLDTINLFLAILRLVGAANGEGR